MSQNPNCKEKSDYHSGDKTKLTLQRVLDSLKTELQNEPVETEATKRFKDDLTFIEKEYTGIPEIVNAYEKAYKDFNGAMKSKAQQQWDSIVSWSENKVTEDVANEITALREGEFYAEKRKKLKDTLNKAEEAFYSLKDCHDYFAAKEKKALEGYDKIKVYEKAVGDFFTDLKNLYEKANGYKEAEKYRSVFAVRLEFDDIRKKTLTPKEGGSLADPELYSKNLTDELRKVVAFKHERYLWHRDFLAKQEASKKDLIAKQSDLEKARQNYDDHIKNIRERLIREAEEIQPAAATPNPIPSAASTTAVKTEPPVIESPETPSKI
jgi:hypothetical protein